MSNDKLHDFAIEQSPSHHLPERTCKHPANRDGLRTSSRADMAADVSFTQLTHVKSRGGKRLAGSCPTALGGQIPQHPVFVPAGQKPPPSPSRI